MKVYSVVALLFAAVAIAAPVPIETERDVGMFSAAKRKFDEAVEFVRRNVDSVSRNEWLWHCGENDTQEQAEAKAKAQAETCAMADATVTV